MSEAPATPLDGDALADPVSRRARWALASLWVSQTARVVADHCLRVFAVLATAEASVALRDSAWHWAVAATALPCVALAPVNGAISNSLPKRRVLVASATFCLAAVATFALAGGPWLWSVAVVALGAAVYGPTRYALLPAAAADAAVPLPRVNALVEAGAVGAIVAGLVLGGWLYGQVWTGILCWVGMDLAAPVAMALALNLLAVLTALPVRFRSDVRRSEPAAEAVAGFFRDTGRIASDSGARGTLLGIAGLRGLVAVAAGAVVAATLHQDEADAGDAVRQLLGNGLWILVGGAAGSLLAGVQGHPRRALGLVPLGLTGLFGVLAWAAGAGAPGAVACALAGAFAGLANVPLMAAYQRALPDDARGNGMAVLSAAGYIAMGLMTLALGGLAYGQALSPAGQLLAVAGLSALAAAVAWRSLLRELIELATEIILAPLYRIRGRGPGLELCPARGPLLVIANHSSWLDPLWVGKVIPRRLIPMMTSEFYDLPVLRSLMTRVVGAIRVANTRFRREAPELREAVAVLDRGECLVVFPEGRLRRREDEPIGPFGQGVWHVLRERPATPVMVCWIEGGWGSYFSYQGGPPTLNKRPDWRRPIGVGVGPPDPLPAKLLDDHRAARAYLRDTCLNARSYLGLPPLAAGQRAGERALSGEADAG